MDSLIESRLTNERENWNEMAPIGDKITNPGEIRHVSDAFVHHARLYERKNRRIRSFAVQPVIAGLIFHYYRHSFTFCRRGISLVQ